MSQILERETWGADGSISVTNRRSLELGSECKSSQRNGIIRRSVARHVSVADKAQTAPCRVHSFRTRSTLIVFD